MCNNRRKIRRSCASRVITSAGIQWITTWRRICWSRRRNLRNITHSLRRSSRPHSNLHSRATTSLPTIRRRRRFQRNRRVCWAEYLHASKTRKHHCSKRASNQRAAKLLPALQPAISCTMRTTSQTVARLRGSSKLRGTRWRSRLIKRQFKKTIRLQRRRLRVTERRRRARRQQVKDINLRSKYIPFVSARICFRIFWLTLWNFC